MTTEAKPPASEHGANSTDQTLIQLLTGMWAMQAASTAARLGIPDALARGPKTPDEVAARVGAHPARPNVSCAGSRASGSSRSRAQAAMPSPTSASVCAATGPIPSATCSSPSRTPFTGVPGSASTTRSGRDRPRRGLRGVGLRLLRAAPGGGRAVRPRHGEHVAIRRGRRSRSLRLRGREDPDGRRRRERQPGARHPREAPEAFGNRLRSSLHRAGGPRTSVPRAPGTGAASSPEASSIACPAGPTSTSSSSSCMTGTTTNPSDS